MLGYRLRKRMGACTCGRPAAGMGHFCLLPALAPRTMLARACPLIPLLPATAPLCVQGPIRRPAAAAAALV